MSEKIASDSGDLPSYRGLTGIFETGESKMSSSAEPAAHESSAGTGPSSDAVGTSRMEQPGQILDEAGAAESPPTDPRNLCSSRARYDRPRLSADELQVAKEVHNNAITQIGALGSGPGIRYFNPTIDMTKNKKMIVDTKPGANTVVFGTFLDLGLNPNINIGGMTEPEKAEQLEHLSAEADVFFKKQLYDDKGKICSVILNYQFSGHDGIVDRRKGAENDTVTLENLFKDMGIDEDSIFIFEDTPCEDLRKELNRVIKTVKGGGYSSLIFAIGTHGGSTVNSLIINQRNPRGLVEIDLFEHIVYVLSEELITIPKIFLVQACRNSKENDLVKIEKDASKDFQKEAIQEVCVVRATIPNQVALRDPDNGSYFFIHLDSVLRERGTDRRLRKVVSKVGDRTAKFLSQVPLIESIRCTKEYKFKRPNK